MNKEKNNSLDEVYESVPIAQNGSIWKKVTAFFGPAYLVSVGYMDPGNWATDIAAGSQLGYQFLWVLLMSNLMAILLQSLSSRLGIVYRRDLAQASRELYSKSINYFLYILAEFAIIACDMAEVLGMAIGLHLLFDIPLLWGIGITIFDTFLLLFLLHKGMKRMEVFIISLIGIIAISFLIQLFFAKPVLSDVFAGFLPSVVEDHTLYLVIAIIGATVMPHNLYLHSSLVQTRKIEREAKSIKQAIRYNFVDSFIALNMAFFVNTAIMVLAAATFYKNGLFEIAAIQDAHQMLEPLLGTNIAPILFALALIVAGQSSTITGTLAGQIVMEGYLNFSIKPWIRRMITRAMAIVPAFLTVLYFGEQSTIKLLLWSQVILSIQLGFAIVPLIHLVSDKGKMKDFVIGTGTKVISWIIAGLIILLNAKLVYDEIKTALQGVVHTIYIKIFVIPIAFSLSVLLMYITVKPFVKKRV